MKSRKTELRIQTDRKGFKFSNVLIEKSKNYRVFEESLLFFQGAFALSISKQIGATNTLLRQPQIDQKEWTTLS
ncbi:unnamed protein product [Caenorhabditis nigoni]